MGLAARGSRKTGDAEEQISDVAELAQVRAQARQVNVKTTGATVALIVVALLLPTRKRR